MEAPSGSAAQSRHAQMAPLSLKRDLHPLLTQEALTRSRSDRPERMCSRASIGRSSREAAGPAELPAGAATALWGAWEGFTGPLGWAFALSGR